MEEVTSFGRYLALRRFRDHRVSRDASAARRQVLINLNLKVRSTKFCIYDNGLKCVKSVDCVPEDMCIETRLHLWKIITTEFVLVKTWSGAHFIRCQIL